MLLDTSACIEYFRGGEKGMAPSKILDAGKGYISILTLAEITVWCYRLGLNPEKHVNLIKSIASVLNITEDIARFAGQINLEQKQNEPNFGMIDAIIYATARLHGLKILTTDGQFKGLDDVEML